MKKVFVIITALILGGSIFLSGMILEFGIQKQKIESPLPYPTGYEVFSALNTYRQQNGLPDLILDNSLCNNLAQRWQHYKDYNNHDGIQEWADTYVPGRRVSEDLTSGKTAIEMVQKWSSSPGHDLAIKNNSKVCVYSAEGLSVAMFSN